MKVLYAGDVFGSPGRAAFIHGVRELKQKHPIDFVVVNAENSAGGRGLTPKHAKELFANGADLITLGDHAWDQRELMDYLQHEPRIVRPANFAPEAPGKGYHTLSSPAGNITVIPLIGRVFMNFPFENPFHVVNDLLQDGGPFAKTILVEMHCEATSEKQAMGRYLDGRVSAVVGTHTHVQTSDATVFPGGTAFLTDLGMTGPHDSIIGSDAGPIIKRFQTGMHVKFTVARGDARLEGALIDIDESTGEARSIETVRVPLPQT